MPSATALLASLRENPTAFVKRATRFPALYASAMAARRRFRQAMTAEDAVTFAQSFNWKGGPIRPTQAREEILWLLQLLQQRPPRTVIEIGTQGGGTLFLWTRVAAADALLIAVDSASLGTLGSRSAFAVLLRGFARSLQRIELIFERDSHAPDTRRAVERALEGRPVDFLFIDGDHSYEGVARDFELYAPLVTPGGLIAFHDVAARVSVRAGVQRFWNELKAVNETMEVVAEAEPSYGIGVYRVPGRV